MNNIAAIAIAAVAIVAGGYGLYQIAFAQGYVEGYDTAEQSIEIMLEDE